MRNNIGYKYSKTSAIFHLLSSFCCLFLHFVQLCETGVVGLLAEGLHVLIFVLILFVLLVSIQINMIGIHLT